MLSEKNGNISSYQNDIGKFPPCEPRCKLKDKYAKCGHITAPFFEFNNASTMTLG